MLFKIIKALLAILRKLNRAFWYYYNRNEVSIYEDDFYIGGTTILTENTYLGRNTNFNGLIVNGRGNVVIGDNFHSGSGCLFITDTHNYNGNRIPYDNESIIKDIVIKDNVWIGSNVVVLGGVTIGQGAIIQAGSVVVSDIDELSIVGGHPAKIFSYRDHERYNYLKKMGRFH